MTLYKFTECFALIFALVSPESLSKSLPKQALTIRETSQGRFNSYRLASSKEGFLSIIILWSDLVASKFIAMASAKT